LARDLVERMIEGWRKADLEIAGALDGTIFYPCQMPKFAGALSPRMTRRETRCCGRLALAAGVQA
jgi:hypothetical protein